MFHCLGIPTDRELSLDAALRVVEGLRRDNVLEVRITGGEPTTRNDWEAIVQHALDSGLVVTLNTHGSYGDSTRQRIAALKLNQVIISLDGPREVHDHSRGAGSFAKTMGTIKDLAAEGVAVRVNTLLSSRALPHLEEVARLVARHAMALCFMQLKPVGRGSKLLDSMPTIRQVYEADVESRD